MGNEQIAAVAVRQHGVIARRQLIACGLAPDAIFRRTRNGRLFPVVRGVYSLSPHVDAWGRRHAAVLAVDPDSGASPATAIAAPTEARVPILAGRATRHAPAVPATGDRPTGATATGAALSHWSAAQAYGLVPTTRHRQHVTLTGTGGRTTADVRIHRARTLLPVEVTVVEGLCVTSPARTILDCATGASVAQVRRLIREAEYRQLLAAGEMAAAVQLRPHHPGRAIARDADPQTVEAALRQTPLEDRTAALLAGLPLPAATPQHRVIGASGRHYRADFAWPGLRLIVEADGRSAHDRSSSFHSDRERDADLAASGWITLRLTNAMLRDPTRVAEAILTTAGQRGARSAPAVVRCPTTRPRLERRAEPEGAEPRAR